MQCKWNQETNFFCFESQNLCELFFAKTRPMCFASFSYSRLSFILSMCVSMSGCKFKCKCLCQANEWKRTNLQQIIYRMGNNKTSVEWNVVGIIVRFWYLPLEFWTLKTDGSTRHIIAVIPQQLMSTIIISAVATADFVNQKGRETKQFSKKTFSRTIDTSLRTHTSSIRRWLVFAPEHLPWYFLAESICTMTKCCLWVLSFANQKFGDGF